MLSTGRKFDKPPHGTVKIDVTRTRGSILAPSKQLIGEYKAGTASWEDFERRYLQEMRSQYAAEPKPFHDLIDRAARENVILTCWEKGDEATILCHRRLLKDFLIGISAERGLQIVGAAERAVAATV